MLNKLEYLKCMKTIRKRIRKATCEELKLIEKELEKFAAIKPTGFVYFLAQAEFMRKKGLPAADVLQFIRSKVQLYHPEKKIREYFSLCSELLPENDLAGRKNCLFQAAVYDNQSTDHFYSSLEIARKNFLNAADNMVCLRTLAEEYYVTQNQYLYLLAMLLWGKWSKQGSAYEQYIRSDILNLTNVGYLIELLEDGENHTFIVAADAEHDLEDCEVTIKILEMLGQSVCVLGLPIVCEIESEMTLADTMAVSLENMEEGNQRKVFHPICLVKNGKFIGDNRGQIIAYVIKHYAAHHLAAVFCTERLLDVLESKQDPEYPMQRITEAVSESFSDKIAIAWTGSYLSYISRIYQFDVAEKMAEAPECEFSIVIPARNSAATLRFTLQTCLEQRFQGNYEILLSDNSSAGNTEIYDLYCELNHSRIRYVQPPRELSLVKSFEFAFLQAKGEFVFSIGSDDGVLPWSLDTLHILLKQYPDEDLFLWARGFYAWPGFNGGQQHELIILRGNLSKGKYSLGKVPATEFLDVSFQDSAHVYLLPSLYINSGCRKRYLKKILEKTRCLWDGACHDLYMGALNCAINEEIALFDYPLTIAGMSSSSYGYSGTKINKILDNSIAPLSVKPSCQYRNYGEPMYSRLERHLPLVGVDPEPFYYSILHLVEAGQLPPKWLDAMDLEKIYMEMVLKLSLEDALLEYKLGYFRYAAQLTSPEMSAFVEKNICKPVLSELRICLSPKATEAVRTYEVWDGKDSNKMVLDASEYGVEDIHGAVKLFERMTGL